MRLLSTILCATLLTATAYAEPTNTGNTLACSLELPPRVSCFFERVAFQTAGLEIGAGVQFDIELGRDEVLQFAPFSVVSYFEPLWSVSAEFRAPIVGGGTWLRVTTVMRW